MKTLILATRNPGKAREFAQLLAPLGYAVITAAEAGYHDEPDETGSTFRANAEIKARAVFEGTGGAHPVLSDDSGLAVRPSHIPLEIMERALAGLIDGAYYDRLIAKQRARRAATDDEQPAPLTRRKPPKPGRPSRTGG